jgi:hypothetical protein
VLRSNGAKPPRPSLDTSRVAQPPTIIAGGRETFRRARCCNRPSGIEKERDVIKKLTLVAALALIVATPGFARPAAGRATQPPAAGLDVQPFPGTPDAPPQTDIGFPTLSPWQLRSVTVTGSRSGSHAGRLRALPDGGGTAFVPRRPFVNGERVSVRALLSSPAAGTASGAPNSTAISWSFSVAAPLPLPGPRSTFVRHDIRDPNGLTHSFRSEPWLHPPIVWKSGGDPQFGTSDDIFTDAQNSIQAGPLILNPEGQLIYFQPLTHAGAFNVEVQSYEGQSVLTYWQGYVQNGIGIGTDMIVSHSYQTVARVNAGAPYHADLHEFQITPQGNALITAYAPVNADLRSVGGPRNGTVLDSIIQEINIATGQVLWEWHAYGHVQPKQSYAGRPGAGPYDFFHINSIQLLPNGNLLVSARHTWAVYEISMRTGKIVWRLGGKRSSFKMGPGTNFEWQHDAHLVGSTLTVFDNAYGPNDAKEEKQSRALQIRLNFKKKVATLVRAYTNTPPLLSPNEGSVQTLPGGDTFVGWGGEPYFTEFSTPTGRQLFSLNFHSGLQSYRGYVFPWWGEPTTPPSVAAVSRHPSGATVYASWNGATDVASWQVLAGPSPALLLPVEQFPSSSFETTMPVSSTGPYYAVQALDIDDRVLETSKTVQAGP